MSSFGWRKNIEDSIKDGLILTATTIWIFFAQKAANVKQPKASLACHGCNETCWGICGGVLVKDYTVYKKMHQRVNDSTKIL